MAVTPGPATIIGARAVLKKGLLLSDAVFFELDENGDLVERKDAEQLDTVMDAVSDRFGRGALQRATTMRGDPGIQLPMLPD